MRVKQKLSIWANRINNNRYTQRIFEFIDRRLPVAVPGAKQQINEAVLSWEGVTSHPHRFGGTEFRLDRRELGHIHGDYLVDIPFPKKVRNEVVAAGQAEPHHILPQSGWISFYIKKEDDVEQAIALLHRSFELAIEQRARKSSQSRSQPSTH